MRDIVHSLFDSSSCRQAEVFPVAYLAISHIRY